MIDYLNRCHFGDVRDVLRRMIADGVKVNCIVTSPPYWGLRSYLPADHADKAMEIGSEPTLREFIATMTDVFMLAREVLADDGTAWINMGDSYAANRSYQVASTLMNGDTTNQAQKGDGRGMRAMDQGFKPKDLMGQPWRLAFALQDGTCRCNSCGAVSATSSWTVYNGHRVCVACLVERRDSKVLPETPGWWLRQDIIWSKPNPMPESIRDRCTKAHEYIFLMSKSERYYYDFEAMQEQVGGGAHARRPGNGVGFGYAESEPKPRTIKAPDGWASHEGGHGSFHRDGREKGRVHLAGNVNPPKGQVAYEAGDDKQRTKAGLLAYAEKTRKLAEAGSGTKNNESMDDALAEMRSTRNRRSVWTVPSEPFKGAHFATFPSKLIEPCILAGCPPGGTVMDIFMGSGTTAMVAERLGRKWIGIDIDERNDALQRERLRQTSLELAA